MAPKVLYWEENGVMRVMNVGIVYNGNGNQQL